jgi:hypothetical protein
MYKSIVIIGLGSLGGFFADNISKMKGIENLILIDPDIIETKNIGNSIYKRDDIGKFKVEAMSRIIYNNNSLIKTKIFPIEYIEGKIWLPESELIVDCRDEICSRGGEIDVRFYISYKTLVIDCEKYHKVVFKQTGRYSHNLSLSELTIASSIASQYIDKKILTDFMERQLVFQAEIDLVKKQANKAIELFDNKPDMVLEYCKGDNKIRNLHETLPQITKLNKTKDLIVIVGQEGCVGGNIQCIKKNEIDHYNNAVKILSEIVCTIVPLNEYYTIKVNDENPSQVYLELLPDTGAA